MRNIIFETLVILQTLLMEPPKHTTILITIICEALFRIKLLVVLTISYA
jgi:hypothetical protein